ncbi:MAG: undecaprenyl-diphosphate phosphatase [Candidatus Nezhaarchaeales archaeon]
MEWLLLFAILGVVQGVTEWIPVSSEGINSLALTLLGFNPNVILPLAIWLHLGTLLAAIVYFRGDIKKLIKSTPSLFSLKLNENSKLLLFILIATLVTCLLGFPLYRFVKDLTTMSGASFMAFIGACLIATGLLQKFAMKIKGFRRIKLVDSLVLGAIQSFSVIPGLSRSGLTIAALLLLGYSASDALKISFLMSIPAIALADAYLALAGEVAGFVLPSIMGIALALIIGYATISILMRAASRLKIWLFCLLIGVLSFMPLIIELLGKV